MCDEVGRQQILVSNIVVIQKQKDGASTCEDSEILGGRNSSLILPKDPQGKILELLQDGLRVIGRTIINNDNLESRFTKALFAKCIQSQRQQVGTISRWNDCGD